MLAHCSRRQAEAVALNLLVSDGVLEGARADDECVSTCKNIPERPRAVSSREHRLSKLLKPRSVLSRCLEEM